MVDMWSEEKQYVNSSAVAVGMLTASETKADTVRSIGRVKEKLYSVF